MVHKAIILLDSFEKDQLALANFVFPEFWLLHGKPMIEHIIEEVTESGCRDITIVGSLEKKNILDYLKESKTSNNGAKFDFPDFHFVAEENIFSALLKIRAKVKDESTLFISTRSFLMGENPFHQMSRISNTAERTVVGLIDQGEESSVLEVETEKIAERIYKLSAISKNAKKYPFVLANRSIASPEMWEALQSMKKEGVSDNIRLEDIFIYMISQGVIIYGCHLKNNWWDMGLRENWSKADESLVSRENE